MMPISNKNPFRYLKPVKPANFLGRNDLLEEIGHRLVKYDGDSFACIGGRRFGKSSLLFALQHYLHHQQANEDEHDSLALFIDFKRGFASETEFFGYVINQVKQRVEKHGPKRIEYASAVKVSLDNLQLNKYLAGDTPTLTLTQFEMVWDDILSILETANGPTCLVLLLDEVDAILDQPWCTTLFDQLRTLIYSSDLKEHIRLVLAGSQRFLDEVSSNGSPLNNILEIYYLKVFNQSAIKQLSNLAGTLPDTVQQAIWEQSGGHPYIAQYLLYHLWEKGIEQANLTIVDDIVNHFLHQRAIDLNGWKNAIEITGLQVYRYFLNQAGWVAETTLLNVIPGQVKRALIALCYHGFIVHDKDYNYRRTSVLFQRWFQNTYANSPIIQEKIMASDSKIIHLLYQHYLNNLGNPALPLNNLVQQSTFSHPEVIETLHNLEERGWIKHTMTDQADMGLVTLTESGRKIANDIFSLSDFEQSS